MFAAVAKF